MKSLLKKVIISLKVLVSERSLLVVAGFVILALTVFISKQNSGLVSTDGQKVASQTSIFTSDSQRIKELEERLRKYEGTEAADERLGQYIINMMFQSRKTIESLSHARMQVLSRSIVRVANDIFETENQKKGFVTALQIESAFLKYAQSPTGPKGLSQVARASFHEALSACGIPNAKDDDVWETDLNLYAGACYFKKQLLIFNNDPYMAIVGYNQGSNSVDAKSYAKTGNLNGIEPLKYVAKYVFLQRNVTDQKTPGIPDIKDLPKPDKKNVSKVVEAMKKTQNEAKTDSTIPTPVPETTSQPALDVTSEAE